MDSDVIGLTALYLVLWIVLGGVMHVSFVVEILGMQLYDYASYAACLRVPGYAVTNFESFRHDTHVGATLRSAIASSRLRYRCASAASAN